MFSINHQWPQNLLDAVISVFNPNTGKHGPEKTPYLDTFHAVYIILFFTSFHLTSFSLLRHVFGATKTNDKGSNFCLVHNNSKTRQFLQRLRPRIF